MGIDEGRRPLDELADELRRVTVRLRFERMAIHAGAGLLPWAMLQASEQEQWRDVARAVEEVMP